MFILDFSYLFVSIIRIFPGGASLTFPPSKYAQGRGIVCFESAAYGKYLCVEPDGKVIADRSWDNSWEQFRLERFSDPQQKQQQRQQRIQDGRSFSPSDDPSDGGGVENGVIERRGGGRRGVGNSMGPSSTGGEDVAVLGDFRRSVGRSRGSHSPHFLNLTQLF